MSLVCKLSYRGRHVGIVGYGRFDGLTVVESREEKSPGTRLFTVYWTLTMDWTGMKAKCLFHDTFQHSSNSGVTQTLHKIEHKSLAVETGRPG